MLHSVGTEARWELPDECRFCGASEGFETEVGRTNLGETVPDLRIKCKMCFRVSRIKPTPIWEILQRANK